MTQTLRRELKLKITEVLHGHVFSHEIPLTESEQLVEELADAVLKLRGFSGFDPSKLPLDWKVFGGIDFSAEEQDEAALEKEATDDFERQLGFETLPWNSDKVWTKFYKFVVKIYKQNQGVWMDYAVWREEDGKYGKAMTNNAIRRNPQMFMDTGYPTYEARKMYRKDTQPEYKKVKDVEETNAVPNPYQKPSILRKKT